MPGTATEPGEDRPKIAFRGGGAVSKTAIGGKDRITSPEGALWSARVRLVKKTRIAHAPLRNQASLPQDKISNSNKLIAFTA